MIKKAKRDAARQGVLVIQPLPGIGDAIWHLPHLQALARYEPEQKITLLTKPRSCADKLLKAEPWLHQVIWLNRDAEGKHKGIRGIFNLARELKRYQFRRVWILHQSPRYALACWLARIPERIGYGAGLQKLFFSRHQALPKNFSNMHPIDKASHLLSAHNIPMTSNVPKLSIDAADIEKLQRVFDARTKPWIALGIGCSEENRRWSAENFAQLAQRLVKERNATVFLVGGVVDLDMTMSIKQYANVEDKSIVSFLGQPLNEVAALLSVMDMFVGNDTGVMNIAAATGTLSFGLFGHSISMRLAETVRNIHAITPKELIKDDNEGMKYISAAQVLEEMNTVKFSSKE